MRVRSDVSRLSRAVLVVSLMSVGLGCDQFSQSTKSSNPQKKADAPAPPAPAAPPASAVSVPADELIAKVNQSPISTTDVEFATLELRRFVEANQQTWKPLPAQEIPDALDLTDVMNNIIDAELRAQDARARGLDAKPDVKQRLAYLLRGFYAQEWERWQRERASPTEDAIHQFYEQNKAGFTDPERMRGRQIVTESLSEAEAVRAKAVAGAEFAQLVHDFSVGPGKEQGGDIGWYLRAQDRDRLRFMGSSPTEGVFFQQLESVAFSLEPGQISQPVKGPDGRYYIVKLEEHKPSRQQTELEAHDTIKEFLTFRNVQQQFEDLRKKAQIDRLPEHLGNVKQ